ncbi:MAG TPA: complex I subunit 1 family protein [Candidatus Limnocylindrales bacterium]|nr:complex I subunit 1 family protein [Candidatus Limnocylindrales bacterium]
MSDTLLFDWIIPGAKSFIVIFMVLNLAAMLLWIERKGSALIQNRVGANRASILGIMPFNLGFVNTLIADPMKLFTKEEFVPEGADKFVHAIAPFLALFPAVVTMVAVPFGDTAEIFGRTVELQAVRLDVGVLYVSALVSMGVYGVALAGWASNNRWALLGSIRGSAQMISYELAMGVALVSMILFYGSLDLQAMVRQQGGLFLGFLPNWGIFYQPVAFLIIFVAGIAESKRVPFDLPECESELIAGYFTEYSGGKQASFMLSDFAESVMVAGLVTTLFFGGWQVPYLSKAGLALPGMATLAVPALAVTLLQVGAFMLKVLFFCWLQILIRWTIPRFRYDQLMRLGWQGMVPIAIANLILTAALILYFEKPV